MTKASDNVFPRFLISEGGSTATPAAGRVTMYAKADGLLYSKDDAGAETLVSGGAGGLGAWTDYTPTLTASTTNPTLGSSTLTGRYKLLDSKTGIVRIAFQVTTGGAWNAGSGEYRFSLPSGWTAASEDDNIGTAHLFDSGTARYAGVCIVPGGGTTILITVIADATGDRVLKHNVPITWATGDTVNLQILVELA